MARSRLLTGERKYCRRHGAPACQMGLEWPVLGQCGGGGASQPFEFRAIWNVRKRKFLLVLMGFASASGNAR